MSKFLLIGPSGIGKSTALKNVIQDTAIDVFDLDDLIKEDVDVTSISTYFGNVGSEIFFNQSKLSIEKIDREKDVLIAVGAGSIDFEGGHKWYQTQNTIALTGNADIIYDRSERKKFHPTIDSYKHREFSPVRQSLYSRSKYIIDVTELTPKEVAHKILEIIKN